MQIYEIVNGMNQYTYESHSDSLHVYVVLYWGLL